MRQLDIEIVGHAGRAGGQHDDPRAEEHRLADPVGHEHDRLARLAPDVQQLEVHLFPRQRVERAERLVHQDQLGIMDQRAGDRGALLHAAGQLVGIFVGEPVEPHQCEKIARARAAFRHGKAEDLGGQQHVVDDAAPLEQERLLKHHADVARRIERLRRRADAQGAGIVRMQSGQNLEKRGLAAAGGTDQRHQLAGRDVEGGLRYGEELAPAGAIHLSSRRQDG